MAGLYQGARSKAVNKTNKILYPNRSNTGVKSVCTSHRNALSNFPLHRAGKEGGDLCLIGWICLCGHDWVTLPLHKSLLQTLFICFVPCFHLAENKDMNQSFHDEALWSWEALLKSS